MAGRQGLWIAGAVLALVVGGGLAGCAALDSRLPNVALSPEGPAAAPPALAAFADDPPVATLQDWTERRAPKLRSAFLDQIYGAFPTDRPARVVERKTLHDAAFDGKGRVEQLAIALGEGEAALRFNLVLVTPKQAKAPSPVIIAQNFCGNAAALPAIEGVARPLTPVISECHSAWARPVVTTIFGRYSFAPPFETLLDRGYATAIFYAGDVVADVPAPATQAIEALQSLKPDAVADERRPGAIAIWAWLYAKAVDVLAQDPRVDANRIAVWGHSRNGKAALLAGAFDPRIAAVIALQAGTAGASLQRNGVGETIAAITESYPHWFSPAYAQWANRDGDVPIDQHLLLALVAPRPVLIGAARRDEWSDPHGAFRAAEGADPVYRLYGVTGFAQTELRKPNLDARIAYYMRPGLHGVHSEDWEEGVAFLDRWLADHSAAVSSPGSSSSPGSQASKSPG